MVEAIIFVGLQASGKSSFYHSRLSSTHRRINLDTLKTRFQECKLLEECIAAKEPLVIDNTNPTTAERARYLQLLLPAGYQVNCYFFTTDFNLCMERNRQRTGKERIPDVGLYRTRKVMQPPTHHEGFAHIHEIKLTAAGHFEIQEKPLLLAQPESTGCNSRMEQNYPTIIPGLRSPSDQVRGLVYFGRMLDKIRLASAGKLPEAWQAARGLAYPTSFDARCCRFLQIDYSALEAETLKGRSDEDLLEWCFTTGRRPSEEAIEIWNAFMTKRGWRDAGTQRLNERLAEIGLSSGTVQTMFEFIDLDEGRLKLPRQN